MIYKRADVNYWRQIDNLIEIAIDPEEENEEDE